VNGIDTQVRYTPEMREGNFFDYMLSIQPYSMARQDPNVKIRRVLEFIQTGLPAMAQAYQMLGPAFNIENAMNLVMREVGIEEGDELINSAALQQQVQMMLAQLQAGGVVADGKAAQFQMNGGIVPPMNAAQPAMPMGGRPQQPNPYQMGPTGGIAPEQEARAGYQERSAELQAAR
jgi:hypothetical protein